jgi:hypothetical protein
MEMLLFLFLVPGRLPWRNDWSQHWKSVEEFVLISCYCIFVLALVPGRSQVIALRRSYCDDCSRSCFYYCSYYKSIILVCCFPLLFLLFRAGHR